MFNCRWWVWRVGESERLLENRALVPHLLASSKPIKIPFFCALRWVFCLVLAHMVDSAAEAACSSPSFSTSKKKKKNHRDAPSSAPFFCASLAGVISQHHLSGAKSQNLSQNKPEKCKSNLWIGASGRETVFLLSPKGKFEPTVCLSFDFIQLLLWEIRKGEARIVWNRLKSKLCCWKRKKYPEQPHPQTHS